MLDNLKYFRPRPFPDDLREFEIRKSVGAIFSEILVFKKQTFKLSRPQNVDVLHLGRPSYSQFQTSRLQNPALKV